MEELPAEQIINIRHSNDGNRAFFTATGRWRLSRILHDSNLVTAFIGACGTRKSLTANKTMGTAFPTNPKGLTPITNKTLGIHHQRVNGIDVLDTQGSNAADPNALDADHQIALLALALADLIVYNKYANNNPTNYGEDLLKELFKLLRRFSCPTDTRVKTRILVVMHDVSEVETTEEEYKELYDRFNALWEGDDEPKSGLYDWFDVIFWGLNPLTGDDENDYKWLKPHIGTPDGEGYHLTRDQQKAHAMYAWVDPQKLLHRINRYDTRYVIDWPALEAVKHTCILWFKQKLEHPKSTVQADRCEGLIEEVLKDQFDVVTDCFSQTARQDVRDSLIDALKSIADDLCDTLDELGLTLIQRLNKESRKLSATSESIDRFLASLGVTRDVVKKHIVDPPPLVRLAYWYPHRVPFHGDPEKANPDFDFQTVVIKAHLRVPDLKNTKGGLTEANKLIHTLPRSATTPATAGATRASGTGEEDTDAMAKAVKAETDAMLCSLVNKRIMRSYPTNDFDPAEHAPIRRMLDEVRALSEWFWQTLSYPLRKGLMIVMRKFAARFSPTVRLLLSAAVNKLEWRKSAPVYNKTI
ncbi:hypothetical protein J8273_2060 [Carpediemonas membranifera]|uniref:Uncharacterized protein n=1 Tax=Carpediemonas membranifera TaxID=201153 RepID=A0A8J6B9Z1_9EUKA|nr:hypothetical protein J8273_2060 [Carpediemonas membranifera]|eukprot:KAG9396329.1 hypothetical protein J8273_2060 [Carpediemonas membranifera]